MNPLNTLPVDQGILLEWYQDLLTARMLDQHLSSISNATSFQGGELVPLICTEPLDPARDRYFPHGVSTATALARGVSAPNLMAGYLDRARWNPPPDEDRLVDQAIHAGATVDGVTVVSLPDGPVLRTLTERGADKAIVVVVSSDSGADRHSDAIHVDGSDAIALVKAIREAVERTRRVRKLTTVVAMVAQIDGRRGPEGADELGIWRQKDPLRNLRQLMIEERILSEDQESEITRRAEEATMVASASSRRAATGTETQDRRPKGVSARSEKEESVSAREGERESDEVVARHTDSKSDSDQVEATETAATDPSPYPVGNVHPAGAIPMGEASTAPATEDQISGSPAPSSAELSDTAEIEESRSPEPVAAESRDFESRPFTPVPEEIPSYEPRLHESPPDENLPGAAPEDFAPPAFSLTNAPPDEPEAVAEEPATQDRVEAGSPEEETTAIEPEAASRAPTDTPDLSDSLTAAPSSPPEQPAIAMDGSISMAGLGAVDSGGDATPIEPPSSTEPPSEIPRHPSRGAVPEVVGTEHVEDPSDESVDLTPSATVSPEEGVGQARSAGTVVVQRGDELTVVFVGMEPTGLSIPGGDILSVHRLSPVELGPIVESIRRTSKPLIVTTPVTRSIGDNIAAHISEKLEEWLDSDVEHITVANPMSEASTIVKAASDLAEY